jgi:hypothetical protein
MLFGHPIDAPLLLVIVGQSNAGGFGTTGSDVPANLQGLMQDVYIWRDIEPSGAPTYAFAQYECGVNSDPGDRLAPTKWAAEAEFARLFRLQYTSKLFIVKQGPSGTQLEKSEVFLAGGTPDTDWHPDSVGEYFDTVKTTVTNAKAAITSVYGIPANNIVGVIFWMQGETDGSDPIPAGHYYDNLTYFINSVRSEWGLGSNAMFITGRITTFWSTTGPVRMAGARIAAGDLTNCKMVDTDDCDLDGSGHYTGAGQQTLGNHVYQAFYGSLPNVSINLSGTFGWTIEEGAPNGTVVGTIAPTNTPYPTPTFEFASGESAGFTIASSTGIITVTDATQLVYASDPSRVFVVRASNGAHTTTTTVTITLTESQAATDVANTIFRFDPNDSGFYTVVSGAYSVITDTKGSGRQMIQTVAVRRPLQATFPASSKNAMDCNNADGTFDIVSIAPASTMFNDTHTEVTVAAVIHPLAGPTGNKDILGVYFGSASQRFGIFYDYTNTKIGVRFLNSVGSINSPTTTSTFPVATTYRVRATKVGTLIELYVNDVLQATSSIGTPRNEILLATETGGISVGDMGNTVSGEYRGYVGLGRIIRGNPTVAEITFLNGELSGWI